MFKFENEIQNTSKIIVFASNHTDNDPDDNRTKKNVCFWLGGGGDIIHRQTVQSWPVCWPFLNPKLTMVLI